MRFIKLFEDFIIEIDRGISKEIRDKYKDILSDINDICLDLDFHDHKNSGFDIKICLKYDRLFPHLPHLNTYYIVISIIKTKDDEMISFPYTEVEETTLRLVNFSKISEAIKIYKITLKEKFDHYEGAIKIFTTGDLPTEGCMSGHEKDISEVMIQFDINNV